MLNKNERMEKLNAMGINTGKYFAVELDNGTKIHLIVDEKGDIVQAHEDKIAEAIIADGYVRNTKLHRRFVMAQMFQGLNYKSYNGDKSGYNEWLKRHDFKYTFDMMLEEIRVLGKLEERDKDTFIERSHFFTKDVVAKTMEDYIVELVKYVDTLPTKKCKGIPYKRVKGQDIFVDDLEKKLYSPLRRDIGRIKYTSNYNELYRVVKIFMSKMIALPYSTPKSKAWIDAYKGEGAFYTLKNLVMFHNCGIEINGRMIYATGAINVLNKKLDEYQGEGWRMFALMKKVIADNGFDFNKKMSEIYND